MKKITLLLLLLLSVKSINSQTLNYHRFETYSSAENACTENSSDQFSVKVNLDDFLNIGQVYIIDFGNEFNLGVRYAKVTNRGSGKGDADFELINTSYTPISPCIGGDYNYHNFEIFDSLEDSKNAICGYTTQSQTFKVNIASGNLLSLNKVYKINFGRNFNLGSRYVRVLNRATGRGDADFSIHFNAIEEEITVNCPVDDDKDGIENSNDNCPNTSNANQNDIDNDGIGDACDSQDNRDSDGDGVQNWQDNCPNQAGPSSNNGCPIGNPDLKPSYITIYSECTSCSSNLDNLGSNRHIVSRNGGILSLQQIIIDNIGEANSSSTKINFYTSINGKTLDDSDYKLTLRNPINIPSISKNGYTVTSTTIFGDEIKIGEDYNDVLYGNYYIIGEIENINESNVDNNTFVIPIYFREYMSKTSTQLTIHDVNGNKINETTVNSKTQEVNIIKSLPEGFYFIDKDGKKSKIYKKN
ncbi:thrombospondin type 3 repeat-containing protein [Tenacibaculum lutimaris]|uniref:Thrombospondin type 3 repeat-containing protein n=1 Tax=Tenacibaculum lutimaris TaxID=285258 RepID=A0A420E1X9_9FLAO|nr:thrombospondin type 3 repeat-containing protein [Tenacibaculum lutimaris]